MSRGVGIHFSRTVWLTVDAVVKLMSNEFVDVVDLSWSYALTNFDLSNSHSGSVDAVVQLFTQEKEHGSRQRRWGTAMHDSYFFCFLSGSYC